MARSVFLNLYRDCHHTAGLRMETLSVPTQAKLRSTQILTSLPQIVSELLQNSLDAGAKSIEIGLNTQEWFCWVKDDGCGINREGLAAIAQEGDAGRYSTSKSYAPSAMNAQSTFGFRGEALASAAELCCLEIVSRTAVSRECSSVILKGGKRLYEGPAVRWRREHPGTVVCVRDAFYNLPVRRLSHPSPSRTWDLVRQEIETYAVVSPDVTFSLEDIREDSNVTKTKSVRIARTSSMLQSFRRIYGHALVEHVEEIDACSDALKIRGFISLCGTYSKCFQFLYINRHPIRSSDLQKIIDLQFSRSSFSRTAFTRDDMEGNVSRRSPRKAEKRPVYVLNITIPAHEIDNCFEPDKTAIEFQDRTKVFRLLSSTIRGFLAKHDFLLSESLASHEDHIAIPSESPRKKRRVEEPIDDSGFMEAETLRGLSQPRVQEIKGTSKSTPSDFFVNVDEESRDVTWTDPDTGESFIIDSRTGISRLQPVQESENAESQLTGSVGAFRSERRTLKLQSQSSTQRPASTPEWLSRALKTNQAYQLSSSTEGPFAEPSFPVHRRRSDATQHVRSHDESAAMQISRDQLRQAQVINQVDRKFIACLVEVDFDGKKAGGMGASGSRASSTIMVLVDQHAADERIRVERFLRPLCIAFLRASAGRSEPNDGPVVTELTCPFPVLLTKHEASLLQRKETIQASFRNWGISFSEIPIESLTEASDSGTSKEYVQVFVISLPSVLSDKLLQGKELQECIKSFLGQLQEGEIRPYDAYFPGEATVGMEEWLSALRHCPRSLLELANSKACRGAIMFNDPLTREQCERLISQLAQAAYPFQCAHGRPSLIPTTFIDNRQEVWKGKGRRRCDWKKFSR